MSTPQLRPEAKLLSSYAGRSGASDGPQNACKPPQHEEQRGYERTHRNNRSMTLSRCYHIAPLPPCGIDVSGVG